MEDEDPWANYEQNKRVKVKKVRYDDMLIPQGSWREYYEKQQRSRNFMLGFGIAFLGGTMLYVRPLSLRKI